MLRRFTLRVVAAALTCMPGWAGEPSLPEGLGGGQEQQDEGGPELPEGLGGSSSGEEGPALPSGLGGEDETGNGPALPEGLGEGQAAEAQPEEETARPMADRMPDWLHGYGELRLGARTQDDPVQPSDASIAEARLQLETQRYWNDITFDFTGDFYADGVMEDAEFDLRRLQITLTPFENLDLRIGRQPLSWGTGDLLFINDLFPKDWQSFFIGRDVEYLKAPSDAIRVGWYPKWVNVDFVYTPQFDHDRFIRGDRISYWNPIFGLSGRGRPVATSPPDQWFDEDEFALRLYRRLGGYEVAAYGYHGYWKSPAGQRLIPFEATFPRLNVYGASVRGPLGPGIFNAEAGWYDSREDRDGKKLHVNNSELRLLLGYEQELATEFTGAVQYYLEHMLDHDEYTDTVFKFMAGRDENRHVFTLRLTKLLMNQTLTLSWFNYYSPSDRDAYMRPNVRYKVTDDWIIEAGGNIFVGDSPDTFFGQFEKNTNIYAATRYVF